jgi:hypothetical protein
VVLPVTLETGLLLAIGAMQTLSTASYAWGRWTQGREAEDKSLGLKVEHLQQTVDHAGQKMSDLADVVQTMETRFRREFVDVDRCKERRESCRYTRDPV